jgi:hypothetical protein
MAASDEPKPKRGAAESRTEELSPGEIVARRATAGLCADCIHSKRIKSDRSSEFYLCGLHATDQSYPKYPTLPVLGCGGYEAKGVT